MTKYFVWAENCKIWNFLLKGSEGPDGQFYASMILGFAGIHMLELPMYVSRSLLGDEARVPMPLGRLKEFGGGVRFSEVFGFFHIFSYFVIFFIFIFIVDTKT